MPFQVQAQSNMMLGARVWCGWGWRAHQTYGERKYVHDDLFGNVRVYTDAHVLLVSVKHLTACLDAEIL